MKCPICDNNMEKDKAPLMYPYYCRKCKGYWSEQGVLDHLGKQKVSDSSSTKIKDLDKAEKILNDRFGGGGPYLFEP